MKGIGLVFLGSLFLDRQLSLGVPTDRRFVCFYFTLAVLYCGFIAAERAADAPARHGGLVSAAVAWSGRGGKQMCDKIGALRMGTSASSCKKSPAVS